MPSKTVVKLNCHILYIKPFFKLKCGLEVFSLIDQNQNKHFKNPPQSGKMQA